MYLDLCVYFTLSSPFYPASSSVHPVPVLNPYPREILITWLQTVRQKNTKNINNRKSWVKQVKASVPGTRTQQRKQD